MIKLSNISEIWEYLKVRKKWWLVPIFIALIIVGSIIILSEGTAVAPFIYAIF